MAVLSSVVQQVSNLLSSDVVCLFVCVDVLGNFEWLVQLEISLISVSTLVFGTFKVLVLVDHLVRALLHCVIV